jgi:hypothetical protein
VTRLRATQHRSLARRFRPGLDYTVAHAGGMATSGALLDATLCFLDDDQVGGGVARTPPYSYG